MLSFVFHGCAQIRAIAERDPVSDSGPIFEAQIGTQFSALGSHCRKPGVCCRRAKTPTPIRPLSPAGAYRFAPDPVQKSESKKQKKKKREKDRRPNAFFRARRGWHSK